MKKLLITLTDEIFELLRAEKEKTGAPYVEIVRRALIAYLCNHKKVIIAAHGYTCEKCGKFII